MAKSRKCVNLNAVVSPMSPHWDERARRVPAVQTPRVMPDYPTASAWRARAKEVRHDILSAAGLDPMPEPTPLNATFSRPVAREGYSVCKAYFESRPGFICTGNLYCPTEGRGPFPGILSPHGHWPTGRIEDREAGSVPGRSINLARLGFVVFSYDMIGYNDQQQLDHRASGVSDMDRQWGISLGGLQLYNSIRAIDFLQSLECVDAKRIGCTGASGGGTQTMQVMAVDDRVKVAAPVCMVSASYQGGCECENTPRLRLRLYNVEMAAAMAPRPLLLPAVTGDWTRHTPWVEYPDVRRIYKLLGAEDRVACAYMDAGHNYNRLTREYVYAWFVRWLRGDSSAGKRIKEASFKAEPKSGLRLWPDGKMPAKFAKGAKVRALLRGQEQEFVEKHIEEAAPALARVLGARFPGQRDLAINGGAKRETGKATLQTFVLRRRDVADGIPTLLATPTSQKRVTRAALVVHPKGKAALLSKTTGRPLGLVAALVEKDRTVLSIDPFLIGESAALRELAMKMRADCLRNTCEAYTPAIAAERVQDVVTAVAMLKHQVRARSIDLIGIREAALWCLLARVFCPQVERTIADLRGLDLSRDSTWARHCYIPGLRRAGDIVGAARLIAPAELHIFGAGRGFPSRELRAVYRAVGAPRKLRISARRLTTDKIGG